MILHPDPSRRGRPQLALMILLTGTLVAGVIAFLLTLWTAQPAVAEPAPAAAPAAGGDGNAWLLFGVVGIAGLLAVVLAATAFLYWRQKSER